MELNLSLIVLEMHSFFYLDLRFSIFISSANIVKVLVARQWDPKVLGSGLIQLHACLRKGENVVQTIHIS